MKNAIRIIVSEIENEISNIIEKAENSEVGSVAETSHGSFVYDLNYKEVKSLYDRHWDKANILICLEVKSVKITNENSKVLPDISNEVFNQLEEYYL